MCRYGRYSAHHLGFEVYVEVPKELMKAMCQSQSVGRPINFGALNEKNDISVKHV